MNNFDYKNMTPFKWFVLENFPFIENDFDAINNYHLFSKVVEYLNKTIDNMNLTGEQMENVTNTMTELQYYVNNYFENLDVPEEINRKIDELVENGTLYNIMKPYFSSVDTKLLQIENKVNSAVSGSPLVASSIAEMTNTSRVYVNTTDGHWYYYNGTEWTDGGVYQATEDSETVDILKTKIDEILDEDYNTLLELCKVLKNKKIDVINGRYDLVDSDNNFVLCVPISLIINDCIMVGVTNFKTNRCLFLDSNFNKMSSNFTGAINALIKGESVINMNATYIAWAFDNGVVPDLTAVSKIVYKNYINDDMIKGYKSEKGINLISKYGYSHGYFSSANYSWNINQKSTNLIKVNVNETISFNQPIISPKCLCILNEDLTWNGRSNIAITYSGKVQYINNSNAVQYIYVTYPTDLQNEIVAISGDYTVDEILNMSNNILENHISPDVLPDEMLNLKTSQNLSMTKYRGKVFSALGDSLTASGSGGWYLSYIKKALQLNDYVNCGIGGTRVSGTGDTCFYQDVRVESLDINSSVVTIMGGTNDANFTTVTDEDFSVENYDTNNFVGAYNVLLSKIFYKFLKLSNGYYSNINYSELTQVNEVDSNFRIILITPPQKMDSIQSNINVLKFASYVERIAKMWGIACVNSSDYMQMNFMTYPIDRTDKIHFPEEFHKKLAEGIIAKVREINPID